jgi:glycosyltransferase involved in cell wall biosynthesis
MGRSTYQRMGYPQETRKRPGQSRGEQVIDRPTIVYVTAALLWPPRDGGRVRVMATLEALTAIGDVQLIAFPPAEQTGEDPPDGLLASYRVDAIDRPSTIARLEERIHALTRLEHVYITRWKRAGGLERLLACVEELNAELVVLEWPFYPAAVSGLRRTGAAILADIVDDRVASIRDWIRHGPGMRRRLTATLDWPALVRSERSIDQLDQVWFARASDAQKFAQRHRDLDVRAIHNAIDEELLGHIAGEIEPRPRSAAFLGSFGYPPNEVAGLRFARGIAPLLPHASLALIGREPTPAIRRAATETGIELLANVPDAARALRQYAVLVAPLSSGQGMSLKLLEAMALRIPIVTTPAAAAGLGLMDGVHALIGQSDAELARAVERLWAEAALAKRLTTGGASLVRERYGRAAHQTLVRQAIGDVLRRSESPPTHTR